jgi:hypothetical protein
MAHKDVIAAIDKEISRLQQAREILAGSDEEAPKTRGRKPAEKPVVVKKRVGRPAGTKRVLSAEARKRIADAQKKRWAAQKAGK